jgi:hypothetical protein
MMQSYVKELGFADVPDYKLVEQLLLVSLRRPVLRPVRPALSDAQGAPGLPHPLAMARLKPHPPSAPLPSRRLHIRLERVKDVAESP